MGKGLGSHRRAATVKIGALVAVLVLTLLVPTLAFAANTATFSGFTPAKGSFVANVSPKVSVVVYDRYGVSGSSNYRIYVDGVRRTTSIARYSGYGLKKFKLSAVPSGLSNGAHTVTAWVKDAKGLISKYSWVVNVDTVAPVTTLSKALPVYPGSDIVKLNATDAGSGVAQTFFILDGVQTASDFVFSDFVIGTHTLTFWSVDKAGNVAARQTMTWKIADGHDMPQFAADASCIAVGCHGTTSVKVIHNAVGCVCHESAANATNDCVVCHSGDHAPANHAVHKPIVSSAAAGSAKDCLTCHTSGLMGIHSTCAACHNPADKTSGPGALAAAAIAGGTATCESCHNTYDATHTGANVSHQVAGSCFTATCHGGDVTKMHTIDFRGDGSNIPGCVACHAPGRTPSTNCQDCHIGFVAKHDYKKAHAAVKTQFDANSALCVTCHGDDFTKVMLVSPKGSGVPTSVTGFDEHKGCSCHAYGEAAGKTSCQDCHGQPDDPSVAYPYHLGHHDALIENSAPNEACGDCHPDGEFVMPDGAAAASGHNTTTFGTIGALTKFDGSEGVVIKNSAEETITQEWPLPTADVFWSQSSMVGTDSPLVAMDKRGFESAAAGAAAVNTQVGWGSVITCGDCHTGLAAVAGPQGANASEFGIDANFPDDWTKASLTTWDPTGMRSVITTAGTENPYYEKRWVGVNNTGALVDTTTQNSSYLWGDVTGRYLCQKCHKLTNFKQGYPAQDRTGRSNPVMGVSNTAHMEHHPDQKFGQGNCVSCHVAIPHGWKRPRLLVYESDPAPYKASQPTTGTVVTMASGLSGFGNWTYNNGLSTHLDAIYAGPDTISTPLADTDFGKELLHEVRRPDVGQYIGWDETVDYVEWIGPGTATGEAEGQPNCNACAATGSTHTSGAGGEGVPAGAPTWK